MCPLILFQICLTDNYGSTGGSPCLLDDGGGGGSGFVGESGDSGEESPPAPLIKTLATPASKPLPIDPLQFVKTPVPPLCKQVQKVYITSVRLSHGRSQTISLHREIITSDTDAVA